MNDIGKLVKSLSFIEEFVETTTTLATERNVQRLLEKVLSSARNFTNCEGGRVYVLDVTKRELQLRISQWDAFAENTSWYTSCDISQVEAGQINDPLMYCAVTGTVVIIDDVYCYNGFELDAIYAQDRINNARTQSLILVPLRDHDMQTIGVLELLNAKDAYNRRYVSFRSLEPIICAFAAQAAVCINNALLIEANDHLIGILNETNQRLEKENKELKQQAQKASDYKIIGKSEPMQQVFSLMDKALNTSVSILLTGETGTGKEVFAKAIHESSERRNKQFVTQNCAALPEQLLESELFGYKKGAFTGAVGEKIGLFELADGGTLFLDEIGDMPLNLQSKLLRVLQESEIRPLGGTVSKKINVRIVAATHCNLRNKIQEGEFREDLFFRLSVFPIELPALRHRETDLQLLMDHFMKRFSKQYGKAISGIAPSALDMLLKYPFPGNVRELQNVIERAVLLCEESGAILPEHFPDQIHIESASTPFTQARGRETHVVPLLNDQRFSSLKNAVNAYEISVIEQHLKANNWNQTRTAETLQIPRRTLIDKMSRYNIKTPEKRRRSAP